MADVFGTEAIAVTRLEAMTVPAVANARWLITTPLARHPLKVYTGETDADGDPIPLAKTPAWLTRTDGQVSPQFRILWTLDDLLFTGFSLWATARDAEGRLEYVERVPLEWWSFNADYQVVVQGVVQTDPLSFILFTSPHDPLLECGARTIRAGRNVEDAWAARVADPIPIMEIRQVEDIELDEPDPDVDPDPDAPEPVSEAQEILNNYVAARRRRTGSVVFVPYGYELHEHGQVAPDLFVNGRNAVALDVGRLTGLPAQMLNASPSSSSLTYTTEATGRSDLEDYSLAGWAMAIQARLSMDDCVEPGQSVLFDLSFQRRIPAPAAGPTVED